MFDIKIPIPGKPYDLVNQLLETGKVTLAGGSVSIDLGVRQNVSFFKGETTFNPPLRVEGEVKGVVIKSTVTTIKTIPGDQILVDIDHSPINIRLVRT